MKTQLKTRTKTTQSSDLSNRSTQQRTKTSSPHRGKAEAKPPMFDLRLYVAGQTPKSLTAVANLKQFCEEHLKGQYHIEVIDLLKNPQLAEGDQILAIPTLVRKLPEPIKKIIGDLSNEEKVLIGLDVRPRDD